MAKNCNISGAVESSIRDARIDYLRLGATLAMQSINRSVYNFRDPSTPTPRTGNKGIVKELGYKQRIIIN